jgi:hypothetical protein
MDDEHKAWADLDDDDYDSLARNLGINDRLVEPDAARDGSALLGDRPERRLTMETLRPIGYAAAMGVLLAWFVELTLAFAAHGPSLPLGSMFSVDVTTLARLAYKAL